MIKVKIVRSKYDFDSGYVTPEEYLEFFGYHNPVRVGEDLYIVETIGYSLPAVHIIEKKEMDHLQIFKNTY